VPEQPPHFVEAGATPKPACRGEVAECVRVKAPIRRQTGLGVQPMENLDEVALLEWPALSVAEKEPL
jgi:hypothetical protein